MNKVIILLYSIIMSTFCCCENKDKSAWDDPLSVYTENIASYHEASLGQESKKSSGNQAVYVDFSNGIKQAMGVQPIKDVVQHLSGILTGDQVEWYGLGEKKYTGVGKIAYQKNRDFFNLVTNPLSYDDIYSPIEIALKQITNSQNDAILITDFEEYSTDRTEQSAPYATPYFINWLKAGNSITFYYHKYTESNGKGKSSDKNLYIAIFNYGDISDKSMLSKFKNAIKNRPGLSGLNSFDLNSNPYTVSNDYGGKEKTGLILDPVGENPTALEVGDKEGALTFYYNGFLTNARPYEAFEFGQSLNNLYEFYFEDKRRFTKKLFLDASNTNSFKLSNIKVLVTDVTSDYSKYIKCLEAKKNEPTLIDDEGKNKIWDAESKKNPVITECYLENSKKLKSEYQYKYNRGDEVPELFDFDASIFSDHLKNSPQKIELITTFHKNFAGKFNTKDQVILRVDYLIEATEENVPSDNTFIWQSIIKPGSGFNKSLSESIRNTLVSPDVKPKGILYSYYLKLEPIKK